MPPQWMSEAYDYPADPDSGSQITRLTSAPVISHDIYCEVPYSSPDGKRIIFQRLAGMPGRWDEQLFMADLERKQIAPVEGFTHGENAAWGEWVHAVNAQGDIEAFSMTTFERKIAFSKANWSGPDSPTVTRVSPDDRYIVYARPIPGDDPVMGIGLIDVVEQTNRIVFTHPEIINPHAQFDPHTGEKILIQHNRGGALYPSGELKSSGDNTTLFAINRDGSHMTPLPAGPPITGPCTGHECFIGDTGKVLFSAHWQDFTKPGPMHEPYLEGNLFVASPGDDKPHCIKAPEHRFNHVSASKCGRYWLCDSYGNGIPGDIPLVIGCFETGKYRTLIRDCGASCGGAQFTHPHAYMTADNGHVVYNADPKGVPHVFVATIPPAFLESLH